MFVDSHCHLDKLNYGEVFDTPKQVIEAAKKAGVEHLLCVGVTLSDFPAMKQSVAGFKQVALSCGVHPLYMEESYELETLIDLASDEQVVAIGETGLDYFYDKDTIEKQQHSFAQHIQVARQLKKPLVIHTRDARQDTIDILKNNNAEEVGGVLHCFTENLSMAQAAMEMGFYISASGIISFHSASKLRKVFKALPIERILLETDSPWLAPAPHRGEENQPAYTRRVGEVLAEIKGISLEEVAEITSNNYFQLFKAERCA